MDWGLLITILVLAFVCFLLGFMAGRFPWI